MKVLVTGAAGFIGMHLALRLARDGVEVSGVDSLDPYYDVGLKRARAKLLAAAGVHCEVVDLADAKATRAVFDRGNFSHVAHLAAQPGVRYSLINPAAYLRNNIDAFGAVIEACRHRASSTWSMHRAPACTAPITCFPSRRTRTSITP